MASGMAAQGLRQREKASESLRQRVKANPGILKHSAQVMHAQTKAKHKEFDSWPEFVQSTLGHTLEQGFDPLWRELPLEERLKRAERLRQQGGELFRDKDWDAAADKYAQAAGLFHYVQRIGGTPLDDLDDCCLQRVTEEGGGSCLDSECAAHNMRATCYANIAQCLLSQPQPKFEVARCACDEALHLDSSNLKAMYRRAIASEGIGGLSFLEEALRDLGAAEALDRSNKAIREAKLRVRSKIRQEKDAEQQLFGQCLGGRGLGSSDERDKGVAESKEAVANAEAEGADLHRRIDEATQLRATYLSQGKERDACEMDTAIQGLQARLAERQERDFDIFRPSQKLLQDAKGFGIDLQDPEQRRLLDQMMWQVNQVTADGQSECQREQSCADLRKSAQISADLADTRSRQTSEDLVDLPVVKGGLHVIFLLLIVTFALGWVWYLFRPR